MSADIISFPAKAKPTTAASDLMVTQACAAASASALMDIASESAAARARGDLSPAMQQIAALAALGDD